jgi:SAM-dependent methyltransferase
MMDNNNRYTRMQYKEYDIRGHLININNNQHQNNNNDYWNIILSDIKNNPNFWKNKKALDFGCGRGRNIINLLNLADFKTVDGCDLSNKNINFTNNFLKENNISTNKYNLYVTDGISLEPIQSNIYDYILSTLVLENLCVHDIRYNIMNDMLRVLKPGGLLTFQMGMGKNNTRFSKKYYDNWYGSPHTNGYSDVVITNPDDLVNDLIKIGFINITYEIISSFTGNHENWIIIKANKLKKEKNNKLQEEQLMEERNNKLREEQLMEEQLMEERNNKLKEEQLVEERNNKLREEQLMEERNNKLKEEQLVEERNNKLREEQLMEERNNKLKEEQLMEEKNNKLREKTELREEKINKNQIINNGKKKKKKKKNI